MKDYTLTDTPWQQWEEILSDHELKRKLDKEKLNKIRYENEQTKSP